MENSNSNNNPNNNPINNQMKCKKRIFRFRFNKFSQILHDLNGNTAASDAISCIHFIWNVSFASPRIWLSMCVCVCVIFICRPLVRVVSFIYLYTFASSEFNLNVNQSIGFNDQHIAMARNSLKITMLYLRTLEWWANSQWQRHWYFAVVGLGICKHSLQLAIFSLLKIKIRDTNKRNTRRKSWIRDVWWVKCHISPFKLRCARPGICIETGQYEKEKNCNRNRGAQTDDGLGKSYLVLFGRVVANECCRIHWLTASGSFYADCWTRHFASVCSSFLHPLLVLSHLFEWFELVSQALKSQNNSFIRPIRTLPFTAVCFVACDFAEEAVSSVCVCARAMCDLRLAKFRNEQFVLLEKANGF